jgi:hypothetical protein
MTPADARRERDELVNVNTQQAAGHWKRSLTARYASTCPVCQHPIRPGQIIAGFGPRPIGTRPVYRHTHCA